MGLLRTDRDGEKVGELAELRERCFDVLYSRSESSASRIHHALGSAAA